MAPVARSVLRLCNGQNAAQCINHQCLVPITLAGTYKVLQVWVKLLVFQVWQGEAQDGSNARQLVKLLS